MKNNYLKKWKEKKNSFIVFWQPTRLCSKCLPSSLNLQIFWWEPQERLVFCWEEASIRSKRENSLLEQREHDTSPPWTAASPKSLSPNPQFLSPCTTGHLRKKNTAGLEGSRLLDSSFYILFPSRQSKKEGRVEKTTENPTGLGIWFLWNQKGCSFSKDKGVLSSLHVLAKYLSSALSQGRKVCSLIRKKAKVGTTKLMTDGLAVNT